MLLLNISMLPTKYKNIIVCFYILKASEVSNWEEKKTSSIMCDLMMETIIQTLSISTKSILRYI